MSKKTLPTLLKKLAGERDIEFTIPYVLLPPRFQALSKHQDMVVCLGRDFLIQVLWKGGKTGKRVNLTPGGFRRLVKDVERSLTKYRTDLRSFSRFLDANADHPPTEFTSPTENPRAQAMEEEK